MGILRPCGQSGSAYFFGDNPQQLCEYANVADQTVKRRYRAWTVIDCNDGQDTPRKRGQYRPNAFGLYDTHGNVSEWVADCGLPDYSTASRDGTQVGQGQGVVVMATEAAHGIQGRKRPPIAFAKPLTAAMVIAASDWSENCS